MAASLLPLLMVALIINPRLYVDENPLRPSAGEPSG
jgi:hypothetical protein